MNVFVSDGTIATKYASVPCRIRLHVWKAGCIPLNLKLSSYIARCPVRRTAQGALHFRPVHSKAISTSLVLKLT